MSDFSSITDWYPYYLNGNAWDRCSLAIEKPYVYTSPTEIAVAYINSGIAYLGKANIAAINVIAGIQTIGPAKDISICYDSRWYLGSNKEYIIYTTGTLFIAYVDTANNLYVKINAAGVQTKLASSVDKCFIVRGWKHISDVTIDQGINLFYTKGGILYYRSYIQTDTNLYEWEDEQQITTSKGVKDIQVYRTSDFRLAICIRLLDDTNQVLITDRVFPGQSVPIETISLQVPTDNAITISPIQTVIQNYTEAVHLGVPADNDIDVCGSFDNTVNSARNAGGDVIYVAIPTQIPTSSFTAFCQNTTVTDGDGNGYPILEVAYEGNWLKMSMADFNNASGSMVIVYNGTVAGYLGTTVHAFTTTFTPVGLVPTPPDPPIPQTASNVNSEVIV
jgi:hypothetical protein